jgi:hypothetical protein
VIVFISSSARPRYADDIIRMLALPKGGQMQFRYSANWLADEVRSRVPGGQLADEYGLVCFVASDKAAAPYELIPVRFVRIIRVEPVGTSYIVTLAADAYASGVTDAALRNAMPEGNRRRLPSAAKAADELYCLEAGFNARPHKHFGYQAFEATAEQLSKQPTFNTEETAFFAVRQISKVDGWSWFGTFASPSLIDRGAFKLRTGNRYECQVYCLRLFIPPKGADGVQPLPNELALVAEGNDDSVQFASAKRSVIDSRYDLKRYVFAVELEATRRVSGIRLFLLAKDDGEAVARQDVSLQMVFGGSFSIAFLKMLFIGVATAGPGMTAAGLAGKLTAGVAIAMIAIGMLAGVAAVFPAFRKP